MPLQPFDTGSKYLVQHQGRGILWLGGARAVRACKAVQAELVQSRRLPDGLLEVRFERQPKPDHVLVEVATYPEKRALEQALDDLSLARHHLKGKLPELLMLALRPKGRLRITGQHAVTSRLGWAELACRWKVVELWTLSAEEMLAAEDVGLVPWVPLARYDGPPAELLERCRERIERDTVGNERQDLLTVSQMLAELRFPHRELLDLLGGRQVMIQSPLLEEMRSEVWRKAILIVLKNRFARAPLDIRRLLEETKAEKKLERFHEFASQCESLTAF